MANKKITTAELDFDQIKSNLKSFMQGQTEFQDYDFEGSGLSILLDVLAYNTHYNALYTNLAVNESFLDSASKRSSVVSLAKNLGYVPKSASAARAIVDVIVRSTANSYSTLTIPKYSAFNTSIDNTTYTFYNLGDTTASLVNGAYTFSDMTLVQGTPLTYSYTVADGVKYILPNNFIDLNTLIVSVQESSSSSVYTNYTKATTLNQLNSSSLIYFIKEIEDQYYEIYFGDGVLGKLLDSGNVVNFEYMVTDRAAANGSRIFSYGGTPLDGGNVSIVTQSVASGGDDAEGIESIRFNAPKAFSTQDRAITIDDYKHIILTDFTPANSVQVWGGEDNNPPVYGKVFITVKPHDSDVLSDSDKASLTTILKTKNVVSVTPEIVDAEFIKIQINTSVYYNSKVTSSTPSQLKTMVFQTIKDYNTNNLEIFDGIFRQSKISSLIDSTDDSFVGNVTTVKLHKELTPAYNVISTYSIDLLNPLQNNGLAEETVLSTGFFMPDDTNVYYIDDDGLGNLRLFYYVDGVNKSFKNIAFGTVNYITGSLYIPSLNITALNDTVFKFVFKPESYDVVSTRQNLITIPDELITINIIVDNISSGNSAGGTTHIFTSSRS